MLRGQLGLLFPTANTRWEVGDCISGVMVQCCILWLGGRWGIVLGGLWSSVAYFELVTWVRIAIAIIPYRSWVSLCRQCNQSGRLENGRKKYGQWKAWVYHMCCLLSGLQFGNEYSEVFELLPCTLRVLCWGNLHFLIFCYFVAAWYFFKLTFFQFTNSNSSLTATTWK